MNQRKPPLQPSGLYRVNALGDLAMRGEARPLIGKQVKFIRVTRVGLAEVLYEGRLYYVPPRNLEL